MMKYLFIEATNDSYRYEDVNNPMTVGLLKEILEEFDDGDRIILSFDRGYSFGSFHEIKTEDELED